MPATRTQLLGWAPSSASAHDASVYSPSPSPSHHDSPTFSAKESSNFQALPSPPQSWSWDKPASPRTSCITAHAAATALVAKKSASGVRRPDESGHIPRPRNSFIIFRCFYSRHNAKAARKSAPSVVFDDLCLEDPTGTMTKRSSEVWNRMSPEERKPWEKLARLEKLEHERLYPNYRFQPKKKQPAAKRRKAAHTPSTIAMRRRPDAKSPSTSKRRRGQVSRAPSSSPLPLPSLPVMPLMPTQLTTVPLEAAQPSSVSSLVKASRRRSASVPQPLSGFNAAAGSIHPYLAQTVGRRSMSNLRHPTGVVNISGARPFQPIPPPIPPTSYPNLFSATYNQEPSPLSKTSPDVPFSAPDSTPVLGNVHDSPSQYVSPLSAVASSLMGWNGESTGQSTGPSTPLTLPLSAPLWNVDVPYLRTGAVGDFAGVSADKDQHASPYFPFASEDATWDSYSLSCTREYSPGSSPQFGSPLTMPNDLASPFADLGYSQALQEFDIGLNSSSPFFMPDVDYGSNIDFDLKDFLAD
ncbi:hypothetical protein HGRIS_013614 [Hohenbuehelia grisea]|uniref:HMG box domain-containing protein n=1 Tax=Hohenbuehelia grisea TaxID=104357 RepID=A0ABR3IW37_9AGAR